MARAFAASATCVVLLLVSGCGDLSRGELSRGVESLSAIAAQGELIASGVARDATKSTYTRVMAKTLGGEAEHEAEKLADAEPEEAVAHERHAAVLLAEEIAELYSQLQVFPGDEHHGAVVQKHMEEAKEKADAIAEGLTGEEQ
jgi:lipopolysaccharide biosynthesis regulator YciM